MRTVAPPWKVPGWTPDEARHESQAQRTRLPSELQRLQELYADGDIDKATHRTERTATVDNLNALPSSGEPAEPELPHRLMSYLRKLSSAWAAGTGEERNRIARELFNAAPVDTKMVTAVQSRPELFPFFNENARQLSSTDAHRRKRRDSNPRSQP